MPTKYPQPSDAEFALLDHLIAGHRCYQTQARCWRISGARIGSWQISSWTVTSCRVEQWVRFKPLTHTRGRGRNYLEITHKGKRAHARKAFIRRRPLRKKTTRR